MKMELMSSLLLFALTLLPPALGKANNNNLSYDRDFNNSMVIKRKPNMGKNILVNINTAMTNKYSDLQSVFLDTKCEKCISCMERAIKAHKVHNHVVDSHITVEDFEGILTKLDGSKRDKRKVNNDDNTKKNKKSKPKKNKSVTVFKYFQDEKIYALKVKESNLQVPPEQQNATKIETTCQLYSVLKSVPCQSPEADSILASSKIKISKRSRKENIKKETIPIVESTQITPTLKKREIDDSQVAEHYMPSIEDMY